MSCWWKSQPSDMQQVQTSALEALGIFWEPPASWQCFAALTAAVSSRCCCNISVFWDVRSGPTVRQHPGFDQQPSTWSECCRASCQMTFWGKSCPPLTGHPQGQRDSCSSRAKGIFKKGLLLKKNIEPVLQLRAFQSPWLWVQFLVLYKDLSITV